MRWSTPISLQATLALAASLSLAAPIPAPPGEPLSGQSWIPVIAEQSTPPAAATSIIPHPGAPTGVVGRQDSAGDVNGAGGAASQTYNDGLYTPWTPAGEATAASSAVESVAASYPVVTEDPSPSATQAAEAQSSIYLRPSSSSAPVESSPSVVATSSPASDIDALDTETQAPTSAVIKAIPTASVASASSSASISSISRSASSSQSASTSANSDTPFAKEASGTRSSSATTSIVVPVAISVGVLAILLAIVLIWLARRRAKRRRGLDSRRYGPDEFDGSEKRFGVGSEFDDDEPQDTATWSSFGPNSRRHAEMNDGGMAGGLAGRGLGKVGAYQGVEQQDGDERGWAWGSNMNNGSKRGRGPLPQTPLQKSLANMEETESLQSLHQDLDAMIAQSRTGYDPYLNQPERSNSISNVASAIYSSLSGRNKRQGSRGSSRTMGSRRGKCNEYGVWEEGGDEYDEKRAFGKEGEVPGTQEQGSARPLLACVDETPRKGAGYTTYTPPDTPTRSTPGGPRKRYDTDDTDIATLGGTSASMQQIYSDDSPKHIRRFTLRDNPVPLLSPGSPRRVRAKTNASLESSLGSPSVYSPSQYSHASASSIYPTALQPGQTPAVGWRPTSPPTSHFSSASPRATTPNILTQSVNGTTYSLSGLAGMLYKDDKGKAPQRTDSDASSYTALPPRKPRRQSLLSKQRPVIAAELTPEAASRGSSGNPHRAVDAVVRAARSRGNSTDTRSSASDSSGWDQQVRHSLRASQASTNSIDDLLTNVLGPARSPV